MAICLDFDWQTDEFMLYCRTPCLHPRIGLLYYENRICLAEQTKDIPGGRKSDWQIHSLLQPGKKQEWRR